MRGAWRIPGTAIEATVLPGVAGPRGTYSRIFRAAGEPGERLQSVNAGTSAGFWVGGGGINAAFAGAIASPDSYASLHAGLLADGAATGEAVAAPVEDPPLRLAYARLASQASGFANPGEGTVFVDVFADGTCPEGNPGNAAMVYACPPNGGSPGYADDSAAFLAAVAVTAGNIVQAVRSCNDQHADAAGGVLAVLRVCAFSTGIFGRPGTRAAEVVRAIYEGLASALASDGAAGLTHVEFPYGAGFEEFAPRD